MKNINFYLGILAIMTLYYLFTRGVTVSHKEGLEGNKASNNLDNQINAMEDVSRMHMINAEIQRATREMAQNAATKKRLVPLRPVPEDRAGEARRQKITTSLGNISEYLKDLLKPSPKIAKKATGFEDKQQAIIKALRTMALSMQGLHPGKEGFSNFREGLENENSGKMAWKKTPNGILFYPAGGKSKKTQFNPFSGLNVTSLHAAGDQEELDPMNMTPEQIYRLRPFNRVTADELRRWVGTAQIESASNTGKIERHVAAGALQKLKSGQEIEVPAKERNK